MDPLCVRREPGMGKGEEASLIRTSTPERPAMANTPNRTNQARTGRLACSAGQ